MAKTVISGGMIKADFIYYDKKDMFDQLRMKFPDVVFLFPKMIGAYMEHFL